MPAPGITGRGWVPVNASVCNARAMHSGGALGLSTRTQGRKRLSAVAAALHSPGSPIPGAGLPSQHFWRALCPPGALLLTALSSLHSVILQNPAWEWCWCWGGAWWELLHQKEIPSRGWEKALSEHPWPDWAQPQTLSLVSEWHTECNSF